MEIDQEKAIEFRRAVIDEGMSFTVWMGEGHATIEWGDENQLCVPAPTGGADATEEDYRKLALMQLSAFLVQATSDYAMGDFSHLDEEE